MAEKGGYKHFMQKEIFEQPRAVRDTLLGRISQDTGRVFIDEIGLTEAHCEDLKMSASWPVERVGTPGLPASS